MKRREEIEKLVENYPISLTVSQVSEIINKSYRTTGELIRNGKIPAKNLSSDGTYGKYIVLKSDLITFLLTNEGESNE